MNVTWRVAGLDFVALRRRRRDVVGERLVERLLAGSGRVLERLCAGAKREIPMERRAPSPVVTGTRHTGTG